MANGEHSVTPAGRQRRATYVEVCKWIVTAWNKIQPESMKNGFVKAGLIPPPAAAETPASSDYTDDDGEEDQHVTELRLQTALEILDNDSDINEDFDDFSDAASDEDKHEPDN